ncbi:unnamed protein product [Lupinus luteus]|uniref:Uncharacterized protein n=1 Tax=Lupinus luteus TaxID=3873 RepID=A0AAV1XVN1_LUPLU
MVNRWFTQVATSDDEDDAPLQSPPQSKQQPKRKRMKLLYEDDDEEEDNNEKSKEDKNNEEELQEDEEEEKEEALAEAKPVGDPVREDLVLLIHEDSEQKPYVTIIKLKKLKTFNILAAPIAVNFNTLPPFNL